MAELVVNEIFGSVQGEGPWAGYPTTFVRLQGCDREPPCSYCDTLYAHPCTGGQVMTIDEVEAAIEKLGLHHVCITGGEPLRQGPSLVPLLEGLGHQFVSRTPKYLVSVETNGLHEPMHLHHVVKTWLVDIKLPSSGVRLSDEQLRYISGYTNNDALICVVGDGHDLDYLRWVLLNYQPIRPEVFVHPSWGKIDPILLVEWLKEVQPQFHRRRIRIRLGVQLHKYIWPPNTRGV